MEKEILFHLERLCLLLKTEFSKELDVCLTKAFNERLKNFGADVDTDRLITTPELQKLLSLSRSSVEALKKKKMPFYKLGDNVRFKKSEVLQFIEQYKKEGGSGNLK